MRLFIFILAIVFLCFIGNAQDLPKHPLHQYVFSKISNDAITQNIILNEDTSVFTYTKKINQKVYIEPSGTEHIAYTQYYGKLDTTQVSSYPTTMHGKHSTDVSYPSIGPLYSKNDSNISSTYLHFTGTKKSMFPCFTPTFSFLNDSTIIAPVFAQKKASFTIIDSKNDEIIDKIILPGRELRITDLIGKKKHKQFANTSGGTYYDIYQSKIFVPLQNKLNKSKARQQIAILQTSNNKWDRENISVLDLTATFDANNFTLKTGSILALTIDTSGNLWVAFKNSFIGCIIPKEGDYLKGTFLLVDIKANFPTMQVVNKRYDELAKINIDDSKYVMQNANLKTNTLCEKCYIVCERAANTANPKYISKCEKCEKCCDKKISKINVYSQDRILKTLIKTRNQNFSSDINLYKFKSRHVLPKSMLNEEIQNSITFGYGGLFAVTNFALYGFNLQRDSIYSIWNPEQYKSKVSESTSLVYRNKFLKLPGHLNTGSGTTPTLFEIGNNFFVTICDNDFPQININIYSIYDTIRLLSKKYFNPGENINTEFGLFSSKGSACENSVVAVTLNNILSTHKQDSFEQNTYLYVGNTFGYDKALVPKESHTPGGLTSYRLRYIKQNDTLGYYQLVPFWDNYNIDVKTATPKLGINSRYGFLYTYKKESLLPHYGKKSTKWWQLAAIDFQTGIERFSYTVIPNWKQFKKDEKIGSLFKLFMNFGFKTRQQITNNIWGTYTFIGGGKMYIGTIRGILIVENKLIKD